MCVKTRFELNAMMPWSENKKACFPSSNVHLDHYSLTSFLHIMRHLQRRQLQRQIVHLVIRDASVVQMCAQQFILLFQFLAAPLQQIDFVFNPVGVFQSVGHLLLSSLQFAYVITGFGKDNTFTLQQDNCLIMLHHLPSLPCSE